VDYWLFPKFWVVKNTVSAYKKQLFAQCSVQKVGQTKNRAMW